MRHLLLVLLLATLAGCASPAAPTTATPSPQERSAPSAPDQTPAPPPPAPPPPLRVVVRRGDHPATARFNQETGRPEGFYVDLVQAAGVRLGRPIEFVERYGMPTVILGEDQADLVVGEKIPTDPAAQAKLGWTPFARWAQAYLYNNRTLSIAAVLPEPVIGLDKSEGVHLGSVSPRSPVTMVTRTGDQELRRGLENAIREMRADGTLQRLSEQWFKAYDDQWYAFLDERPAPAAVKPPRILYLTGFPGEPPGAVAYGRNTYVGTNFQGQFLAYSRDGQRWTKVEDKQDRWRSITFGGGLFVAVANQSVATSTDGVNWQRTPIDFRGWFSQVAYGNGQFVAVGSSGAVLTSPDGQSWSLQQISEDTLIGLVYGNGEWLATGKSTYSSKDGRQWTRLPATGHPEGRLLYGNGRYLSTDFSFLTDRLLWIPPERKIGPAAAFGDGLFVAVGDARPNGSRSLWTSTDGEDWTPQPDWQGGLNIWWLGDHFAVYRLTR